MDNKTETVKPEEQEKLNTERLDKAAAIISLNCKWAAAAGFIPVPYLDLAGLTAVHVKTVNELAGLYGKTLQQEAVKTAVAALVGVLATAGLAPALAATTLKLVPGLGAIAGGVGLGAVGSATTYAIGKVFLNHFEGGGTLADFSVEKVKEEVKSAFTSKASKA